MQRPLSTLIREQLGSQHVCILSDYAKGTLAHVTQLIQACRDAAIPVLVDPKGTDFSRYRGANVLTPNRAEFEAVAGVPADDADWLLAPVSCAGNSIWVRWW